MLNVSNRYGAWHYGGQQMLAINNVELISDRPLEVNLREIARSEARLAGPRGDRFRDGGIEARSLARHRPQRIEDTGADGIELNYGCPHGMSERGMGSAVGQVPEYCEQITRWVMDVARIPVIVKLTPNITNIVMPARAAVAAGASALSLINTLNSIIGRGSGHARNHAEHRRQGRPRRLCGTGGEADRAEYAVRAGQTNGGERTGLPISGMGGIATWQDAAEFLLLGASSLQVCTAVMHYGFRIIEDLCDGLIELDGREGIRADFRRGRGKACSAFRISRISICRSARWRASISRNASSAICVTSRATTRRISASI